MRLLRFASVVLAASISACDSDSTEPADAAIGIYDKQPEGQSRSANCGGTYGTVVDGWLVLSDDHTWNKVDVNATPSGSAVCGFLGGIWQRDNTTTLTLTPGVPGFAPAQATIAGDELTLSSTGAIYTRRP